MGCCAGDIVRRLLGERHGPALGEARPRDQRKGGRCGAGRGGKRKGGGEEWGRVGDGDGSHVLLEVEDADANGSLLLLLSTLLHSGVVCMSEAPRRVDVEMGEGAGEGSGSRALAGNSRNGCNGGSAKSEGKRDAGRAQGQESKTAATRPGKRAR